MKKRNIIELHIRIRKSNIIIKYLVSYKKEVLQLGDYIVLVQPVEPCKKIPFNIIINID